jgi:cellobiose-specific phosphotransferase system component IIC
MKFAVGVMLTAFGTFFAGEGLGVAWWHDDLVLLPLIGLYLGAALLLVVWMRRPAGSSGAEPALVRVLRAVAGQVWGLVVDSGSMAVLTLALLLGIGYFVAKTAQRGPAAALLAAGVVAAVTLTLHGERRRTQVAAGAPGPAAETRSLVPDGGIPESASIGAD